MTEKLKILSPLHKASRQIGLHLKTPCAGLGLRPADAHMLSYIAVYGPCPINEVVRIFGHKKSTLTGILDRLEKEALIERSPNPNDRRSTVIASTKAGRLRAQKVRGFVDKLEAECLAQLSKRDLAGFDRVMEVIASTTGQQLRQE